MPLNKEYIHTILSFNKGGIGIKYLTKADTPLNKETKKKEESKTQTLHQGNSKLNFPCVLIEYGLVPKLA